MYDHIDTIYINLLNLSWIKKKKMSIFEEYEALKFLLRNKEKHLSGL